MNSSYIIIICLSIHVVHVSSVILMDHLMYVVSCAFSVGFQHFKKKFVFAPIIAKEAVVGSLVPRLLLLAVKAWGGLGTRQLLVGVWCHHCMV